jgi:hypothetical protein
MSRAFESRSKQLAFSDFTANFITEEGKGVTVRALTGKRVINVEIDAEDRVDLNLTVPEACSLRFKLGKALRMGFGMYAD